MLTIDYIFFITVLERWQNYKYHQRSFTLRYLIGPGNYDSENLALLLKKNQRKKFNYFVENLVAIAAEWKQGLFKEGCAHFNVNKLMNNESCPKR